MDFSFDFVIVGGGSAGCVLANRLSADPMVSVCLIEAGGKDRSPLIHIPLAVVALYRHRSLNWQFESIPQEGAKGRRLFVPRGRVLGGSSSINGMVYSRGNRLDYDDWERQGNPGWGYDDVLPYFRKSESNGNHQGSPFHGTSGELPVNSPSAVNPMVQDFLAAAREQQLPRNLDFDGESQDGFGMRQVNIHRGRRFSTAQAFLRPARDRANLTVLTHTLADQVLFNGTRAKGIRALRNGKAIEILARREVILSGGSIASPLILMRSGIGDADELRLHKIPLRHKLSGVGQNLQDHPSVNIQFYSRTSAPYGLSWRSVVPMGIEAVKYLLFRRGVFTTNGLQSCGFHRSDPTMDRPDLQFIFQPILRRTDGKMGIGHGFGLNTVLLKPRSRGRISLSSASPDAPPLIDFGVLNEQEDLQRMTRGVRLAREILLAHAFDRHRGETVRSGWEGSDRDIEDYIRSNCGTIFHPVGTCKMGTGAEAVVDSKLRVHGLQGLRVVDASIMPTIVGGNTNAPVIMIAEKASDMILKAA